MVQIPSSTMTARRLFVLLALAGRLLAADQIIHPVGKDGHRLNLDFETGDLRDWTATGDAFTGQPIKGDTVQPRRGDMRSNHTGDFWIGGYERSGDDPKGVLTSAPFQVSAPWASFLFAAGRWAEVRAELVEAATGRVFFRTSGVEDETLRPVVVSLAGVIGRDIFIRLVDDRSGHWGHLNFDDFLFHTERPKFANELTPAEVAKGQPPPADVVLYAGLSPQEACEKATLPDGFKMQLFAGEPDIVQPIAFCFDHRGRIWVAEGLCYPLRRDDAHAVDEILCFEDTDGDGRFDRRTVIATNLNLVSGLEWGYGGLFVGAAPNLMFIPIADGDVPKMAGPPEILLDGWNYTADTHEVLNTFTWGPDGWLYGCHGVFCPSLVGKPGAPEEQRQWVDAAVWRYHPILHTFEIFTEGGSNPWGIDFDEHGDLWAEMCVIPHLFNMVQGGRMLRQGGEHYCVNAGEAARNAAHRDPNSHKPIYPYAFDDIQTVADHLHWAGNAGPHAANGRSDAVGGGHAHAGLMVYQGASWPAEYRGSLIIGNIHGQRLNRDIPVRSGSGYVGRHAPDFMNFNDTWSQTLNQKYDQDGSVFIIDWYDKNQCHHNRVDGHDRSNGRIYKLVYNSQPTTRIDVASWDDAALAKGALSTNEWVSRHARLAVSERIARKAGLNPQSAIGAAAALQQLRTAAAAFPAIAKILNDGTSPVNPEPTRLRALWALDAAQSLPPPIARLFEMDADEWVRSWAIRIEYENASEWLAADSPQGRSELEVSLANLNKLATTDPSPLVRRHVASALLRVGPERRGPALEALGRHAEDINDHNLPLLYWYAAEGVVATQPAEGLRLLESSKIPKLREFIARRLATVHLAAN